MPAFTNVQICNLALAKLGHQSSIQSLDEGSAEARLCNTFLNAARQDILRRGAWSFAIDTAELAQTLNTPDDYDYEYQLPSGFLRLLGFVLPSTDLAVYERRKDGTLVCDYDEVIIKYVFDEDDPSRFDATFVEAFALRLAADLAFPLTGNAQMAALMERRAAFAAAAASQLNKGENRPDPKRPTTFIDARG